VEVDNFYISDLSQQAATEQYFLLGCRLAPYKRVDLAIEAFKQLGDGYRLKIFGDGVDLERLKQLAEGQTNIEFLGRVDETTKARLYSEALAFINPQEEDFGITVVEAMASGRPVIAYQRGGATETVKEGETGLFFTEPTAESLVAAIRSFRADSFNPELIKKHAAQFSVEKFREQIQEFIAAHQGK